ncbi:hypothetical protein ISN45_Aa05g019180 [Arabidopsis thaliana x Arabidopsis arenosa]|uniref:Uncharacterized protein n=1 Tax=Arabidopsis thaliana x Arabidopsis arenosa TaxID=1240361 RepID=A0A8T1ZP71_9BRAS|nr:hypothetical protein ISN45_Aa05g019180 [Arabidopsis thaliana x Arabidopsis arenosa]
MKRWCIRWMIRKAYNGGYSFGCGGGGGRREEGCYGGGDGGQRGAVVVTGKVCVNILKDEAAMFEELHHKFMKDKADHLQGLKDTISEVEEDKESLYMRYEQLKERSPCPCDFTSTVLIIGDVMGSWLNWSSYLRSLSPSHCERQILQEKNIYEMGSASVHLFSLEQISTPGSGDQYHI